MREPSSIERIFESNGEASGSTGQLTSLEGIKPAIWPLQARVGDTFQNSSWNTFK